MASFFIEDKYFEAKLDDGTVVYTRTRFIVEALKYYRNECFKIIENGEKTIKETPRLMVVGSFEDAMKRIDKITDTQVRIRKAHELIDRIDKIFKNLANGSSQSGPSK
ncbi:MAG: hypothetical protein IJA23_05290 [Clostridia bacterium]|nr:hypothetical protein [Clostridia bacterium]